MNIPLGRIRQCALASIQAALVSGGTIGFVTSLMDYSNPITGALLLAAFFGLSWFPFGFAAALIHTSVAPPRVRLFGRFAVATVVGSLLGVVAMAVMGIVFDHHTTPTWVGTILPCAYGILSALFADLEFRQAIGSWIALFRTEDDKT